MRLVLSPRERAITSTPTPPTTTTTIATRWRAQVMANLAQKVGPLAIRRQQLTKSGKKSEEQELQELLARRAQSLKAAEPKAAKGEMSGLDRPELVSFEVETSLLKYPTL
jgi:hypothetical protein